MVGFQPDVEQTETAQLGIRTLMSGIPLITYGSGIWLFRRFELSREKHAEIRQTLDARLKDPSAMAGEGAPIAD
jgi:Na+/melibiose symporter-like transporter